MIASIKRVFVSGIAVIVALPSLSSFAQGVSNLEEIIVTAQRREQSLMDVPLSITTFDADKLESVDIEDIRRIADFTPGLVTSGQRAEQGNLNIYIRGIGSNAGSDPAVGYYVDEIYTGSGAAFNTQFIDVERVEVLKGPQGTLWGRNTTGGAINVITKKPTDEFESRLFLELAELNTQKYAMAVSGPIVDTLKGRLTVARTLQDYHVQNVLTDKDDRTQDAWSFRGHLQWEPTDDLDVLITLGHMQDDSHNLFHLPNIAPPGSSSEAFRNFFGLSTDTGNLFDIESELTDPKAEYESLETRVDVNYRINDKLRVRSLSGWNQNIQDRLIDLDGQFAALLNTGTENETEWGSQELQAIYNSETLDITAGLYYYKQNSDRRFYQPGDLDLFYFAACMSPNFQLSADALAPLCPVLLLPFYTVTVPAITNANFGRDPIPSDYSPGGAGDFLSGFLGLGPDTLINNRQIGSESESVSAYAEANWRFVEQWTLTFGLRYIDDKTTRDLMTLENALAAAGTFEQGSKSFNKVTPKVGIEWRPVDDTLLYVSYTSGYKSGGFGSIFRLTDNFEEETVDAFEAGMKTSLLDGRLRLQAAAFYYDYTNLQVTLQFPDRSRVTNVDQAEVLGFEFGSLWYPTDAISAGLNVTYLDTEVNDFTPTDNILDPFDLAAGAQDIVGNPLPVSPEWQGVIFGTYTFNLGGYGSLRFGGDISFSDEYVHDIFGSFETPSYTLYNANMRWTSSEGKYSINAFGRNLSDKTYIPSSFFTDAFGVLLYPAQGRVAGIQFSARF